MPQGYDNYYTGYEEPKQNKIGLVVGLVLLVAVVVALFLLARSMRPHLVPAPAAYINVQASDQSFTVDRPVGWSSTQGSFESTDANMDFSSGSAKITVESDLAGSTWGDFQQAENNQDENMASMTGVKPPPPIPPIETVHRMGEQEVASQYSKYAEQPMTTITAVIGEGRQSEFTGNGGILVGPVHGYRASFLDNERRITVVTVCPQRNWAILAPSFEHVIQSVGIGKN